MAAPNSKCYRYSISELQDIETRITTQFDLSKLSFSAVRGKDQHKYDLEDFLLTFVLPKLELCLPLATV